jgi:hypothetical protein
MNDIQLCSAASGSSKPAADIFKELNLPAFQGISGSVLASFSNDVRKAIEQWDKVENVGIEYVSTQGFTTKERTDIFTKALQIVTKYPANRNPRFFPAITLAKGNCEGYRVELDLRYYPDDMSTMSHIGFDVVSVKCWSIEDQVKIYQFLTESLCW